MLNLENNDNITKVIIPDTVTEIGRSAFYKCENIQEIVIPNSVKEIKHNAFYGTRWYENLSDTYTIVGDGVLIHHKIDLNETELTIPNGVKYISSFIDLSDIDEWGKYKIKKVNLPEGVEIIGQCAFAFGIEVKGGLLEI